MSEKPQSKQLPHKGADRMRIIDDLMGNINLFLNKVIAALESDGIGVSDYELDHLCYRVDSLGRYEEYKNGLSRLGKLLTEEKIGDRKISTFKLVTPVCFKDRKIYLIELPAPKEGSPYPEGLEHVEFVITDKFDAFIKKYPNVHFDLSGAEKGVNPDIKIKYDDFSVKFHHQSLENVIRCEQI